MNEYESLLHAVISNPEDDTPRLILADWLEDHGEAERADFIRRSIARTAKRVVLSAARGLEPFLGEPVGRSYRTGKPQGYLWITASTGRNGQHNAAAYHRGFISALRGPLSALLEHGPAIVREHPVERVEVTDANDNYFVQPRFGQDTTNAAVLAELRRRVDDSSTQDSPE